MIKYLILTCLLLGAVAIKAQQFPSGISFLDCGDVLPQETSFGMPFYAIQDKDDLGNFGRITFTPDGSNHWEYSWTFNGVNQPVLYSGDSTTLYVDLLGDGVYNFTAVKDGNQKQSGDFRLFYVYVPKFEMKLSDEYNCSVIKVNVLNFERATYSENGIIFPGKETYLVYFVNNENYGSFVYENITKPRDVPVTYKDEVFTVTIQDQFGFKWKSDQVKYTSVIPKAAFNADPQEGEAPLDVDFRNESINAQKYEWFLYRDTADITAPTTFLDSLIDGTIRNEESFPYTYEHTGMYKVFMVATNTRGDNMCTDTAKAIMINVSPSLVEVPNVFTPNGDGINDVFKAKTQSLEWFQGVIINRWGRKVHEWTNPDDGWDGRINGKYANPGTYYYIITARGREMITKKYVKKGPLLLVR